jgi:hypothetical protein
VIWHGITVRESVLAEITSDIYRAIRPPTPPAQS